MHWPRRKGPGEGTGWIPLASAWSAHCRSTARSSDDVLLRLRRDSAASRAALDPRRPRRGRGRGRASPPPAPAGRPRPGCGTTRASRSRRRRCGSWRPAPTRCASPSSRTLARARLGRRGRQLVRPRAGGRRRARRGAALARDARRPHAAWLICRPPRLRPRRSRELEHPRFIFPSHSRRVPETRARHDDTHCSGRPPRSPRGGRPDGQRGAPIRGCYAAMSATADRQRSCTVVGRDRGREQGLAHQELVDGGRARAALGDRPHDEALTAAHVAAHEHVRRGSCGTSSSRATLPRSLISTPSCSSRPGRCGPTKPIASSTSSHVELEVGALDPLERHPPVDDLLLDLVRTQPAQVAVVVAEEALGVDRVDALAALFVRGRDPVDHRVGRPRHRLDARRRAAGAGSRTGAPRSRPGGSPCRDSRRRCRRRR